MARFQSTSQNVVDRNANRAPACTSVENPFAARRRCIPFRMLADAFATEDEELAPEPDWADFAVTKSLD